MDRERSIPSAKESFFFLPRRTSKDLVANQPKPKCLPKSQTSSSSATTTTTTTTTTTRETSIQPQTQALKLLLQQMEWPQFQPNFDQPNFEEVDTSWEKPKIMGAIEAAAEKASEERQWLLEQYLWFYCATRQTSIGSEAMRELDFYFKMYHFLLDVTDIQNAHDILKEVQHLLLTQEHKHAVLTSALEESEKQLVAKREELKLLLLLKDQEGDGTAQVG